MSIKKILVPMSGQYDPEDMESLERPALETAFRLAQRLRAHVEVVCIEAEPQEAQENIAPWVPGSAVDTLIDAIKAESENRRERAKALFKTLCGEYDVTSASAPGIHPEMTTAFLERFGDIRDSLVQRGRISDLIVCACPPVDWKSQLPIIVDKALRESGRPVLISPPQSLPTLGERVVVAWNGSAGAMRAIGMAMDILQSAKDVVVISIDEGVAKGQSEDSLIEYLRWHGIIARLQTFGDSKIPTGQVILDQIATENADMLVMGAYTHSHLQRIIFGSVTSEIFAKMPVPVFMVE